MRSVTILCFAFLLASCRYEATPDPLSSQERAAVYMLQLGYDKWVVACAYTVGRDGGSLEQADQTCRVEFDLPPLKNETHANGSN